MLNSNVKDNDEPDSISFSCTFIPFIFRGYIFRGYSVTIAGDVLLHVSGIQQ